MSEMLTYRDGAKIDWANLFHGDPDLLDRVLGGIGKVDKKNRSWANAPLNLDDYSEFPFRGAVKALLRGRSLADLELDVNLDDPSKSDIEAAAKAFGRHPSYFIEYRINYVCSTLAEFLESNPETLAAWYVRARQSKGIRVR